MMTAIRINAISTLPGLKDLAALIEAPIPLDAIFLPKVQNLQEIELYTELLGGPKLSQIPFVALIETAYGMQYAHEIASHFRVAAIAFGGGDLSVDLGVKLDFASTIAYRSRIVQAAHYAHKPAWDVPYLNFHDDEGLRKETRQVKDLGFSTKVAIHPNQLQTIVEILSPTPEEIEEAKAIVKTYQEAQGYACEYKAKCWISLL